MQVGMTAGHEVGCSACWCCPAVWTFHCMFLIIHIHLPSISSGFRAVLYVLFIWHYNICVLQFNYAKCMLLFFSFTLHVSFKHFLFTLNHKNNNLILLLNKAALLHLTSCIRSMFTKKNDLNVFQETRI